MNIDKYKRYKLKENISNPDPTIKNALLLLIVIITFNIIVFTIMQFALKIFRKKDFYLTKKLRKITNDDRIEVYKISSKTPNAFNAGTPALYYFDGLQKTLKLKENEVIAILLHEYHHYNKKHVLKSSIANVTLNWVILSILYKYLGPIGFDFYLRLVHIFPWAPHKIIHAYAIGRPFEYAADTYAAKMGYGKELARSLIKLHKYVENEVCKNLSKRYKTACKVLLNVQGKFDEHPEVHKRVENILETHKKYIKNAPLKTLMRIKKDIKSLI
ncbi:MAG: M48 family metalloprotease [archaeon]